MQIGIYGGSFDPVHLGHLNLAVEIMEAHRLDQVWFCPSFINPFKQQGSHGSVSDRLAMLQLAIQGESRFCITDVEIKREGPSYTIDTLHQLIAAQGQASASHSFALILGEDAARTFCRWHKAEEIVKCARLLVGSRGESIIPFEGSPAISAALEAGLTATRIMEISSTEIRQRLANNLFCGHLLPGKVLDYILAHALYLT
jgi:nicotinate-nucleotide adenylyltransferase